MKQSIFTKITMIAIIALISVTAKASNEVKFYTQTNGNTKIIYKLNEDGKTLSRKLKYEFVRDESGNIVEKKAYKWNLEKNNWKPYYRIKATHNEDNSTLHYAEWNSSTKKYDLNTQESIYKTDGKDYVTDYKIYKKK